MKNKRRPAGKLVTLLLSLCMIVTMMPLMVFADDGANQWADAIYVLGKQIGSSNCNDVLGDGKVSYDRTTRTLTLDNAIIDLANYDSSAFNENNSVAGIDIWNDTTINLVGNSTIRSEVTSFEPEKEYVYGITAVDEVTITGGGTLNIDIDASAASIKKFYGIDSSRKLTVNDNSSVNVKMTSSGDTDSTGISAGFRGFALTDGAKVFVDGGANYGLYDRSYNKSTIENEACLTMQSSTSRAFRYSKLKTDLTELTVKVSNSIDPVTPEDWNGINSLTAYKYVQLTGGVGSRAGSVYVLGKSATEDGLPVGVTYDDASNTLTLDGATIDLNDFRMKKGNEVVGLYSMSDLNVYLKGSDNKIIMSGKEYCQPGDEDKEYISGIECCGNLNISGESGAKLSIVLGDSQDTITGTVRRICGIDGDDGMTVDGVSLDVNVGPYGNCNGMYLWCPIIAENGANITVVAEGTSNKGVTGTNDIGKTVISADSVLEMTATGEKGVAFDCWTAGEALKASGALVNENPTADGAYEWNKSSRLPYYKYVRVPFDSGRDGSDEVTPPDPAVPETPAATVVAAALKDNPLAVNGKSAKVKYSKLRKKSQTLAVTKLISFSGNGEGAMAYSISSAKKGKKSFKKYFKINSMTGKVTVKKKLRRGTYKVKINVSAAGNDQYKPSDIKTVTVKIRVK